MQNLLRQVTAVLFSKTNHLQINLKWCYEAFLGREAQKQHLKDSLAQVSSCHCVVKW